MHPALRSQVRKVFGVQFYKNTACALLSRIVSILNSDWTLFKPSQITFTLYFKKTTKAKYKYQVQPNITIVS